jgi:glycine dehydrogenase
MCGLEIVSVGCDKSGNIDIEDLTAHLAEIGDRVALIMLTYPSTHGVFEPHIVEVCSRVHKAGGLVYIDGANLNAMVGLCLPGQFGGDVSHLNLHKTFCIPHGGGGPGVGPVMVGEKLRTFLPANPASAAPASALQESYAVSASQWGSAGILPISWMYLKMMGASGLRHASEVAILNANYISHRLEPHYPILYKGEKGCVAHECIVDLRPLGAETGIDAMDVAKRLMDYGFHAPTISFPVTGTIMIEPTESECKQEIDRFCDAMIAIREEIDAVARGDMDALDNPLKNAPHTAHMISQDDWKHPYSRIHAAQLDMAKQTLKYWPPVARIDYAHGDRNPQYTAKIDKEEHNLTE